MSVEQLIGGIEAVEAEINPLGFITPTNKSFVKERFLSEGTIGSFTYPDGPDATSMSARIDELRAMLGGVPDTLRRTFASMIDALALKLELAQARGSDRMPFVSASLYGELRPETISRARGILRSTRDPQRPTSLVDAIHVKAELEDALASYGLTDWSVVLDDREITAVVHGERAIRIPRRKRFARDHARRLAAHEVGVHVLRAENGRNQPLRSLSIGLPGFYETEEGLAVFSEVALGTISMFTIRQYALRVLAVHHVLDGLSMVDSCRRFRDEWHLTDAQAFDVSFRAYRGGGLVKDHIYLQGFFSVREHLRTADLNELYIGKIGLGDLALVETLRNEGWIGDPQLLPVPAPTFGPLVENL